MVILFNRLLYKDIAALIKPMAHINKQKQLKKCSRTIAKPGNRRPSDRSETSTSNSSPHICDVYGCTRQERVQVAPYIYRSQNRYIYGRDRIEAWCIVSLVCGQETIVKYWYLSASACTILFDFLKTQFKNL